MSQEDIYNDDFFRKAGENYPLKTDNANWDAVFNRLHKPVPPPAMSDKPAKGYTRYAWFLLLLLIPAGFWLNRALDRGNNKQENIQKESAVSPLPKTENKQNATGINPGNGLSTTVLPENKHQSLHEKTPIFSYNQGNNVEKYKLQNLQNGFSTAPNNMNSISGNDLSANNIKQDKLVTQPTQLMPWENNSERNNNKDRQLQADNKQIEINTEKESLESIETVNRINKLKIRQRFYLGLSAGPSFSSVKNQSLSKSGYSLGMLVGYKLDKNWSVETGVLFVKKYFTADGADFKKDQVKLPAGTTILKVNGAADITQVPLNLVYNFNSKTKSNFYVSTGLISNVIHTESYDYDLSQNTTGTFSQLSKTYKRGSDNVFSNLVISAGYAQDLGKMWNVKVEPYYQIPLFGIGLGSMPVRSLGVNIQLTKSIK